jgi:hypothetical protein
MSTLCVAALFVLTGCGWFGKAEEEAPDAPEPEEVRDEVVEKLDCSGVARQETRSQVRNALEGRDLEKLAAKPAELARIVAGTAVTTDTSALLWGNVGRVVEQKYMRSVLTGTWSELECGARHSKTCNDALSDRTSGEVATAVQCSESDPDAVRAEYRDGCRLFGTKNSGAVTYNRESTLQFADFVVGTVRAVDGKVAVETESEEIRQISLDTGDALTVTRDPEKDCEKQTTIRELTATDRDHRADMSFDASRTSDDKTVRVRTPEDPVAYAKPVDCSCPTNGTLQVRHSDPVGLGEPGEIQLSYSSGEGESCSKVEAEVLTWPEGCDGNKTCGRDLVQDLVGDLVTASCSDWTSD